MQPYPQPPTRNIDEFMTIPDIAASVRRILTRPPAPGLTTLDCIGGVYCAERHQLRAISLASPAAVFVLEGRKTLRRGEERLDAQAGDMFLLPSCLELNIENQPDARTGSYLALCLSFPDDVVDAVCAPLTGVRPPTALGSLRVDMDRPMLLAVGHLLNMSLAGAGARVLRLCLEEILELSGQRTTCLPLLWEMASTWSSRCARIIALDPGREWSAAAVAARLCVSERGLRRNLQIEGSGLRHILQDIRLNAGLGHLQSGACTVGEAAARSGYASASRFAALFRERFGVSPAEVLRFNAVS